MKLIRTWCFTSIVVLLTWSSASGQVLISLLLGDKLNSDKIEFGLDGGLSLLSQREVSGDIRTTFNLGFFFNIRLNEPWYLHTGVIVKSPMGERGIQPYGIGDPQLDPLLAESEVIRKLRYFHIPVLIQRRFGTHYFLEGGPQIGIKHKAKDVFLRKSAHHDKLEYEHDIKDQIKTFDAGFVLGLGYRFREGKSVSLGSRWYAGLVNVYKGTDVGPKGYNNSVTIFASIPIGAGKANQTKGQ